MAQKIITGFDTGPVWGRFGVGSAESVWRIGRIGRLWMLKSSSSSAGGYLSGAVILEYVYTMSSLMTEDHNSGMEQ